MRGDERGASPREMGFDDRLDLPRRFAIQRCQRLIQNPERGFGDERPRERFDREARVISQLTHPHICTVYDVGRVGAIDFLVMEYLEGETLAQRLARGPLPVADALCTALQSATDAKGVGQHSA